MALRRLFRLLIALTVAAGLVSAPVATAFAKPHASIGGEMHAMHMPAMADEQAMAEDMPCCPDEGKASDCASCPLLALCMISISIPLPEAAGVLVTRDPLREAFSTSNDARVPGLGARPPDHPPRTSV
ncbi:MAG: hypothetical protein GY844_16785 [Bradyrhizobium sp.]|nr:hypothetical protein [Bradyrhizobium sp.]